MSTPPHALALAKPPALGSFSGIGSDSEEAEPLTDYLTRLADLESDLIADLEAGEVNAILDTRHQSKQLEKFGWRIECACDHFLIAQTERAPNGRGNKDVSEKGIRAAVARRAKQIGVTPNTLYVNARIFRLIQEARNLISENNILELLEDKGYWKVADTAASPASALKSFAEKKATLPRFRVSDAARLLKHSGGTRKATAIRAVEKIREDSGALSDRQRLFAHIQEARETIKRLMAECPDKNFREQIWEETLLTIQEQEQDLFDGDATDALVKAWSEDFRREDQMASKTGLPLPMVSRLMDGLCADGKFFQILPRDMRERSEFRLWHKAQEFFDNAQYMPKDTNGRS